MLFFPAHKCENANNCWHCNIYEQEKFHAQLSWAWKKFYNLGAWLDVDDIINVFPQLA